MNRLRGIILSFLMLSGTFAMEPRSDVAGRAKADSLPAAVAERVRWIEEARRENPELFEKVARCYELVFSPRGDILGRADYHLRGFTLDLLHPKYHTAIETYPDVYAAIKAAYDRALERVEAYRRQHPGLAVGPRTTGIWKDYEAEVRRIAESSKLPDDGTFGLLAGAVKPPPLVRLDPATLPAWEAALLDPNVPWLAKGQVGRIVARFEDPGSTPIIGWFVRRATLAYRECQAHGPTGPGYLAPDEMRMRMGAGPPLDPCEEPATAGSIVAAELGGGAREDTILELAGVLRDVGDPESIRSWGGRFKSNPRWMEFLEELAKDPEKAARLEPLLTEVGLGKKKRHDPE